MTASREEKFIGRYLAQLTEGFPGALGLTDDCAEIAPLPGHGFVVKTDPIVEHVHFFSGDAPEDLAWKALAVNVSDLAAKGARPVAYLMALTLPEEPEAEWMARFAKGLREAQDAFGCVLIGGDTDRRPGPLSIAITVIGEVRSGQMVRRAGAEPGDIVYVSGELGLSALGLHLRLQSALLEGWPLDDAGTQAAYQRYLRPEPRIGLRAALQTHARSAMDVSDGLLKDLDRMCRLTDCGAHLQLDAMPMPAMLQAGLTINPSAALELLSAGDDYEVLATVEPENAPQFERLAARGGVAVRRIGHVVAEVGMRLFDESGTLIDLGLTGYDHFTIK